MPTLASKEEEEEERIEIARLECLLVDEKEKNKHVEHRTWVAVT